MISIRAINQIKKGSKFYKVIKKFPCFSILWLILIFLSLQGLIIERIRIQDSISAEENKRFIYLGDGSGDYCPGLRLKDKDFMMPRKNFPVWELICNDPLLIKAEIHEWSDGEEMERVLLQLINKISMEEFISADCKRQTLSVAAHGSIPQVLPVRQ